VDYRVRRESSELDSTGYVEIGPGKYAGKHWQDGFLFVWEDAFAMAEGIVAKHVPNYDHFSMTDIPKEVGRKVIAEWRAAADRLPGMSVDEARAALNLQSSYRDRSPAFRHGARERSVQRVAAVSSESLPVTHN
jgi:hypothetical protein